MEQHIIWKQHLSNYEKALQKLDEAVVRIKSFSNQEREISSDKVLHETIKDSLIHRFKYTFDFACSLMIDYAKLQGNSGICGKRDAINEAFQLELISDKNLWMNMITSRIRIPHSYDESIANEISENIMKIYYTALNKFHHTMKKRDC